MNIEAVQNGDQMVITLSGRLDATAAPLVEDALKGDFTSLVFDCAELSYVSSAGLRQFIAAKKRFGDVTLRNVGRDVQDVLDMTGLSELLSVEKALRQISVEGLRPIASGTCGDCYRIDGETILKLYKEGTNPDWVRMEKEYAKAAFLMGIPTALSYDVVACGNRRGVLFELLGASSLAVTMSRDRAHIEAYAKQFAEIGKLVHSQKGDKSKLPDRAAYYESLLPREAWLSSREHQQLIDMLAALPRADTCLHGDFHAGNVMVQNSELLFIDMGDFSIGHPYWDLSLVYNMYTRDYRSGLSKQVTKLDKQDRERFFESFLKAYFGEMTKTEHASLIAALRRFACVRQLAYIPEFAETREENIAFMREVLAEQSPVA